MKLTKKQEIIAKRLVELEKLSDKNPNDSNYMCEMDKICSNLSIEDMMKIDEYIIEHSLLTK